MVIFGVSVRANFAVRVRFKFGVWVIFVCVAAFLSVLS